MALDSVKYSLSKLYMRDVLRVPIIRCTHGSDLRATQWLQGLNTYINVISKICSVKVLTILRTFSKTNNACWNCLNKAMSLVSNEAKISGVRCCNDYVYLLDLFALAPWTQYNELQVGEVANQFCMIDVNKLMFPNVSDSDLYNDVYEFCVNTVSLPYMPERVDDWLVRRSWANHGTAGDVSGLAQQAKINDMAIDKATLAYILQDQELEMKLPLINKAFPKRDRKPRVIVVGPTSEYIIGSFVNYSIMKYATTKPYIVTNMLSARDWEQRIEKRIKQDTLCFPIDQSAFDLHQRKAAVLAARDYLIDVVGQYQPQVLVLKAGEGDEMISHASWREPRQWKSGLLSGKWYTSIVGSILNAFEIWNTIGRDWRNVAGDTFHQGDDAAVFMDMDQIAGVVIRAKQLNIPINPDKNFVDLNRLEYLHTMWATKTAVANVGDVDTFAEVQLFRYPARALTSILWGDQDTNKESTAAVQQSLIVKKKVDRIFTLMSRVGSFTKDTISKMFKLIPLTDDEINFAKTPTSFGGLGALELGPPQYAVAANTEQRAYFGVVKRLAGYGEAVSKTERQIGRNLQEQALGAIESSLRFNKLPHRVASRVRKNYYNLKRTGKGIDYKTKAKFTRVANLAKMLPRPVSRIKAYWPPLQEYVDTIEQSWTDESIETKQALKHAGKLVVTQWEKGKLDISINYSKRLNTEALSKIAEIQTQKLLTFLASSNGRDVGSDKLREIKFELEVWGHDEANSQSKYYICR